MTIEFEQCNDPAIQKVFLETVEQFDDLDVNRLVLQVRDMKKRTMQAQPIINRKFWFTKSREYKIELSPKMPLTQFDDIRSMPSDVLRGWFAHEIGHIVDYQDKSPLQMIQIGILYLASKRFRMGIERAADLHAIANGFGNTILATKRFIVKHSDVNDRYLKYINKYYMSIDEVEELLVEQKGI